MFVIEWEDVYPIFSAASCFPASTTEIETALPAPSLGLQPLELVHLLSRTQEMVLINRVLESGGSIELHVFKPQSCTRKITCF